MQTNKLSKFQSFVQQTFQFYMKKVEGVFQCGIHSEQDLSRCYQRIDSRTRIFPRKNFTELD